jgi:hypothetical protein
MPFATIRARISHRTLRPGTPARALVSESVLRQRAVSAQAVIRRAETPKERRRAQRRMAAAKRELRKTAARREYRNTLPERHRAGFDGLSLRQQDQLLNLVPPARKRGAGSGRGFAP